MGPKIRFGEMYELRFQREGTRRQFKHPPQEAAPLLSPSNSSTDSLQAYILQNNLSAMIAHDEYYALDADSFEQDGSIKHHPVPSRWILMTEGPTKKTISRYTAIQDALEDQWQEVLEERKSLYEFNLEMLDRYRQENMFPRNLPKVTLQYTLQKAQDSSTEIVPRWTNRADVLKQIQADRIDRWDPTEFES